MEKMIHEGKGGKVRERIGREEEEDGAMREREESDENNKEALTPVS